MSFSGNSKVVNAETSHRFYPDFYPSFPDEPLKDNFTIVTTGNQGEGVISLKPFTKGQIVFRFAGLMLDEITLFTLQLKPGRHLHDPFFMGKILHCCTPNMLCDMESRTFVAIRDISPREFLTMDYESTEDVLSRPFECQCNSPECRHYIMGKMTRANATIAVPQKVYAAGKLAAEC